MSGSSPVRIDRDRMTRQCQQIAGLYSLGEGAGYAGCIVSAAVEGFPSARELPRVHAPLSIREKAKDG